MRLEQEFGFFFNMRHFEVMVTNGDWDEMEKYLSGFTKVDDNRYSMKIFFEIRKQKYLETLDNDHAKAVDVLVKDLKVFSTFNEDLFKEITQLLTLENFSRDNEQLSKYGDTKSTRSIILAELKIEDANLNWQHQLCKNPKPNPDIKTLFVDHSCGQSQPNGAHAPSPVTNPLMGAVSKAGGFPPLGAHGVNGSRGPAQAALPTSITGWMTNPSPVPHTSASVGPIGFITANNAGTSNVHFVAGILKRPRTPTNNAAVDYQTADSEHVLKRSRPFGMPNEVLHNNSSVNNLPVNILPVGYNAQSHGQSSYFSDDLPKPVVMTLNQGSAVKSMDFHPVQQILLLVGINTGEIMVWDLSSRERLAVRNLKVWELQAWSMPLQASLASDYTASINRVIWSPDGTLFEIDAHSGSVNDLAFSYPNKQLSIVTCGEDRCGMQLQGKSSILLRVMKHPSILYVHIARKTFRLVFDDVWKYTYK
ncbi:unnamed protein product [Camellia sinensis]